MNLTDVSKSLDVVQATMVAVDRKFKSFGSRLQEAEKKKEEKEENLESVTDRQNMNYIDEL